MRKKIKIMPKIEENSHFEKKEFNIALYDEQDIYINFNKKESGVEDLSTKVVDDSTSILCNGLVKEKYGNKKKVTYWVKAKGDFIIKKEFIFLFCISFLIFSYLKWLIFIQVFLIVLLILCKKLFDDSKQYISFEPNKLIIKNKKEINLKEISSVLLANLNTKTIIEERKLSYHWYVENLILEDMNNDDVDNKDLITVKNKKGRYSILVTVNENDIEVLRELSLEQAKEIMKEITD